MSDILKEGLQALCERLSAKAFPLTPHDTAEPCITLCDLQEECRALAARAAAPLPTAREPQWASYEEWEASLPRCLPWDQCDGDLPGEPHADNCPMKDQPPITLKMAFEAGRAASQPVPGLQRTAGDVIRQFRESGSEDWGELESAINWWAMNDFCPNFMKGAQARICSG